MAQALARRLRGVQAPSFSNYRCLDVYRAAAHARQVIKAWSEASINGESVVGINGKMIDRPVFSRAKRIVSLAKFLKVQDREGLRRLEVNVKGTGASPADGQ